MLGNAAEMESTSIWGKLIATGRGTYLYDENGKPYYSFVDSDAFKWEISPKELQGLDIDEEDLLDCCEQAVKDLGDPEEYRQKLGLLPNSGYSNVGITFRSKTDDRVICVFTPTQNQNGDFDCYFEWYLQEKSLVSSKKFTDFLNDFERLVGPVQLPKASEITIPNYQEASEKTSHLAEDVRQDFLERLWKYQKSESPGYRSRIGRELLGEWRKILKSRSLLEAEEDSKLVKTAKWLAKKFNGEFQNGDESQAGLKVQSDTGLEFDVVLMNDDGLTFQLRKSGGEELGKFKFDGLNKRDVLAMSKMISDHLFLADSMNQGESKLHKAFRSLVRVSGKASLTEAVGSAAIRFDLTESESMTLQRLQELYATTQKKR